MYTKYNGLSNIFSRYSQLDQQQQQHNQQQQPQQFKCIFLECRIVLYSTVWNGRVWMGCNECILHATKPNRHHRFSPSAAAALCLVYTVYHTVLISQYEMQQRDTQS